MPELLPKSQPEIANVCAAAQLSSLLHLGLLQWLTLGLHTLLPLLLHAWWDCMPFCTLALKF